MLRRAFAEKAILILGGIVTTVLSLPALAYLLAPGKRRRRSSWTDAGDVAALPEGQPTELTIQREKADAWKTTIQKTTAWVIKEGDEVTAFGPSCPHLGCGYRWADDLEQFVCPCHDSFFTKNGGVISGPSPRPLDRYKTRVEGGRLFLGEIVQIEGESEA